MKTLAGRPSIEESIVRISISIGTDDEVDVRLSESESFCLWREVDQCLSTISESDDLTPQDGEGDAASSCIQLREE